MCNFPFSYAVLTIIIVYKVHLRVTNLMVSCIYLRLKWNDVSYYVCWLRARLILNGTLSEIKDSYFCFRISAFNDGKLIQNTWNCCVWIGLREQKIRNIGFWVINISWKVLNGWKNYDLKRSCLKFQPIIAIFHFT